MKWAALIAWIVTAGGGLFLFSIWLARGGTRQQQTRGRIRPPLILNHFLLAATGLVVWIIYVIADSDALAWVAFVILAVVALLGFTMFGIWSRQRGAGAGSQAAVAERAPEQGFPVAVVGLHGLLAVTTVVLVLLAALDVG